MEIKGIDVRSQSWYQDLTDALVKQYLQFKERNPKECSMVKFSGIMLHREGGVEVRYTISSQEVRAEIEEEDI